MKRFLFVMALLLAYTVSGMAQADRQYIRSGNKYYRQQNFVKAEAEYRKSLSVNPENPQALYNLGCALVMQKKDSVAVQQFEKAAKIETGRMRKAKIYHNIGFVCQSHKLYGDAINAYKESLRNNPADNETRYNLALCQRLNKSEQNRKISTLGMSFVTSFNILTRSSTENNGVLVLLFNTPTIRWSTSAAERFIISRCPNVTGSKLPGYIAFFI